MNSAENKVIIADNEPAKPRIVIYDILTFSSIIYNIHTNNPKVFTNNFVLSDDEKYLYIAGNNNGYPYLEYILLDSSSI